MTGLDEWLKQATRRLSKDSAAQVRTEIREHYESARDAALRGGSTASDADRLALTALGEAKTANRQYRQVLLTCAEARMLRNGNWEARAVCSRSWKKRLALAASVAIACAVTALVLAGPLAMARAALVGGIALSPLFAALVLPVYTPSRGRIFRGVKWAVTIGAIVLALGPETLTWSWLFVPCLWPIAWIEWTRASIRRKLPVEKWPKQLYL